MVTRLRFYTHLLISTGNTIPLLVSDCLHWRELGSGGKKQDILSSVAWAWDNLAHSLRITNKPIGLKEGELRAAFWVSAVAKEEARCGGVISADFKARSWMNGASDWVGHSEGIVS